MESPVRHNFITSGKNFERSGTIFCGIGAHETISTVLAREVRYLHLQLQWDEN